MPSSKPFAPIITSISSVLEPGSLRRSSYPDSYHVHGQFYIRTPWRPLSLLPSRTDALHPKPPSALAAPLPPRYTSSSLPHSLDGGRAATPVSTLIRRPCFHFVHLKPHASIPYSKGPARRSSPVLLLPDANELQLSFNDPTQQRYEIIRPLVLFHIALPTASPGNRHTSRNCRRPSSDALNSRACSASYPTPWRSSRLAAVAASPSRSFRNSSVSKASTTAFGYRELARIIFHTDWQYRIHHHTVKHLWQQLSPALPRSSCPCSITTVIPSVPKPAWRSLNSILKAGVSAVSVRFLHVSRPTINAWISAL